MKKILSYLGVFVILIISMALFTSCKTGTDQCECITKDSEGVVMESREITIDSDEHCSDYKFDFNNTVSYSRGWGTQCYKITE
jgi:hypothetical protein